MKTYEDIFGVREYKHRKLYDGSFLSCEFWGYEIPYSDMMYHREDGPAYIWYNKNGSIECEAYYIGGIKHRDNGPAEIRRDVNGNIITEIYYYKGLITCNFGPAYISYIDNKVIDMFFYINNRRRTEEEWYSEISDNDRVKYCFDLK
jgi:hypothetical protein